MNFYNIKQTNHINTLGCSQSKPTDILKYFPSPLRIQESTEQGTGDWWIYPGQLMNWSHVLYMYVYSLLFPADVAVSEILYICVLAVHYKVLIAFINSWTKSNVDKDTDGDVYYS